MPYIEIKEATEIYGYPDGRPRITVVDFDDIEDKEKLAEATFHYALENCRPKVQLKATGYKYSNLSLGEVVTVIADMGIRYKTRIFKIKKDFLSKSISSFEFGDKIAFSLSNRIKSIELVKKDEELRQISYIESILSAIESSYFNDDGYQYDLKVDNKYKLPAGFYSFNKPIDKNPTKVIYFGAGKLMIANSKKANGEWDFRVALNGDSVNANVIRAGLLQGGRVFWNLEDGSFLIGESKENYSMYWDGSTLHFRNADIDLRNNRDFSDFKNELESKTNENNQNIQSKITKLEQSFTITSGKVNSEIISLREEIDQSGNDIKKYISENYSSREQTDTAIQDKVGSVKNYVDTNFSTRTQTDQMIKSVVSSVKSDAQDAKEKAEKAYSEVLQTEREVSSKVGVNDVYSIIQQLPESVKIDAQNIDLSGNVDITGTFQTSSYGKRVKIEGSAIKFYDYSSLIGSMTVDSDGQITFEGSYSNNGYIRLNSNSGGNVYRNFSSDSPQSWLGGKSWGATALELTGLYSSAIFVDREFRAYELATFYGKPLFKDEINLDDKATINVTRAGGQVWISQTSSGLSFVIDFDSKKTFFS